MKLNIGRGTTFPYDPIIYTSLRSEAHLKGGVIGERAKPDRLNRRFHYANIVDIIFCDFFKEYSLVFSLLFIKIS